MKERSSRRQFLGQSAATVVGSVVAAPLPGSNASSKTDRPVRVGAVGVGGRGTSLLRTLLKIEGVLVPAVCDLVTEKIRRAQDLVASSGQKLPEGYQKGPEDYRRMMEREDLDAVIIATPWEWHTAMAVQAMKAGKYAASEVPIALTLEECWQLVNTSQSTGMPCMMLENTSYWRYTLAVLNMIRAGLLGEIMHCHCAHSHNIWWQMFDRQGKPTKWYGEHVARKNCDQYPCHALGPVLSWMDINCGDRFDSVVSVASRSVGINAQLAERFGADSPAAQRQYAQGDVVTSIVKTAMGRTLVINNDMQLPRPYDNRWLIQGTRGIYSEERDAVHIAGMTPASGSNPPTNIGAEKWEEFEPYQDKYDHLLYRNAPPAMAADRAGSGAIDYLELDGFIRAVRDKTQTPIDVCDSVVMSVIYPLSLESIAHGSTVVKCPDFTKGAWRTTKPKFAVDAEYPADKRGGAAARG